MTFQTQVVDNFHDHEGGELFSRETDDMFLLHGQDITAKSHGTLVYFNVRYSKILGLIYHVKLILFFKSSGSSALLGDI